MRRMEFSIKQCIGVLRPGAYSIELNEIEWGNMRSKFDLRTWKLEGDKRTPCRGLTMDLSELRALKHILNGMEELKDEQCRDSE